jgi:hypothetical protein
VGCRDCRDSALRLTIFTTHRTPFEALRRYTLDIIADVEGNMAPMAMSSSIVSLALF